MASNYSCLLIDLDGTLFDFELAEKKAITEVFEKHGLKTDEESAKLYSEINDKMWKAHEKGEIKKEKLVVQRFADFLKQSGQSANPAELNKDYVEALSKYAEPFPGAEDFLKEVAEFCTLAAITNGSYQVQRNRLHSSGIEKYFDAVFISERIGCVKPAAKFFEIALNQVGVKSKKRVLVVGDSLSADIKGGKNAGLDTCWCNFAGKENTTGIEPQYTVSNYEQLKLIAVGEEELKNAAIREKRHLL